LVVGNDLDTAAKKELDAHLSACPPCRGYWQDMESSMYVLRDPAAAVSEQPHNSVWPRVASRLPRRAPKHSYAPFRGWMAAASVALACSVLVAYGVTYQSPGASQPFAVPGQMIGGLPSETNDGVHWKAGAPSPRDFFGDENEDSQSREFRSHRDLDLRFHRTK